MQKITVIGTGYVGLIAGLGFAKWGNEVVCLDVIPEKIEKLQRGVCPIYEPGAEVQLADGLASGRLRFTCDVKEAVEHGDLIFIAVGTPEAPDGSSDLKYVYSAADEIAEVRWMTLDELASAMTREPQKFASWFIIAASRLIRSMQK